MNNFTFGKLKFMNFLSVGDVPCEINLNEVQSTLVVGTNGAGKTTIAEAITFALFDKSYRGSKKGDLVNRSVGKGAVVELELINKNDEKFIITRTIKPNGFEIRKEGEEEPIPNMTGRDGQKKFEAMFGLDETIYRQLITLGTVGYTEFMCLSTPKRRELVEELLGLNVLTKMNDLNKAEIKRLNDSMDVLEAKERGAKMQLSQAKEYVEKNKIRIQREKDSMLNDIKINKDKYEALLKEVELSEKELEKIPVPEKVELESSKELNISDDERYQEYKGKITECDTKLTKVKQYIGDIKVELYTLKTKQDVYKEVLKVYEKGGSCPSCMQEVSKGNSSEIQAKFDELGLEISSKNDSIATYEKAKKKIEDLIDDHKSNIESIKDEISKYNFNLRQEERRLLQENSKREIAENKHNSLVSRMNEQKSTLKRVVDKYKNYDESFDDNSDNIKELETRVDEVEKQIESNLLEIQDRKVIETLLKDNGIRADIVNRYIPFFNQCVQKYLDILGANYIFSVDSEFNEKIYSAIRGELEYNSFSRGEQSRIDLAILFSWRDIVKQINGQSFSLLFLDEVFDSSIDDEGVKSLKNVINSLEGVNVFTISHKDHNPDDFDSVIRVNKVGRFSTYEREFMEK